MANNGLQGWLKLKKVIDGGDLDGDPLDINNNRPGASGLPQAKKDNIISDPDYIPPIENFDVCPIEQIGSGTCYTVVLPNEQLNDGMGNDLYITVRRPGQSFNMQPYYGYLSILDPQPNYTGFIMCSETIPEFRYGIIGPVVTIPEAVVTEGGLCENDSQCNF